MVIFMSIFQKPSNLVFFLDAFIAYANFFYGKEMAKKIYVYYMDNSEVVSTNIKHNSIGSGEFFIETRNIIQMIECSILKEKESIYFMEYPYINSPETCVQYNDFLKIKHILGRITETGQMRTTQVIDEMMRPRLS